MKFDGAGSPNYVTKFKVSKFFETQYLGFLKILAQCFGVKKPIADMEPRIETVGALSWGSSEGASSGRGFIRGEYFEDLRY